MRTLYLKTCEISQRENWKCIPLNTGLPWWLSGKESAYNAGATRDSSSISGWGRSPGGGHGNPLQYSCLKNPMDRGAWQATVHRVAKSQLNTHPPLTTLIGKQERLKRNKQSFQLVKFVKKKKRTNFNILVRIFVSTFIKLKYRFLFMFLLWICRRVRKHPVFCALEEFTCMMIVCFLRIIEI